LTQAIVTLASEYGRYGYRRNTALLRISGWRVGKDLVQRIWRREGRGGRPDRVQSKKVKDTHSLQAPAGTARRDGTCEWQATSAEDQHHPDADHDQRYDKACPVYLVGFRLARARIERASRQLSPRNRELGIGGGKIYPALELSASTISD
jgi:hypothetical protein